MRVVIHVHTCDSACGAVGDGKKKCAKLLPYGIEGVPTGLTRAKSRGNTASVWLRHVCSRARAGIGGGARAGARGCGEAGESGSVAIKKSALLLKSFY